jgi:O-antigen/teichoic acid export membrane protein
MRFSALRVTALQRIVTGGMAVLSTLVIANYMAPAEQGFYYAFVSFFFLQMLFELGFTFALVNLVAHERTHMLGNPGDATAAGRYAGILRVGVVAGGVAGTAALIVIPAIGWLFFSSGPAAAEVSVEWQMPWLLSAIGLCLLIPTQFVWALLEGSDRIASVAWIRLAQEGLAQLGFWVALYLGLGLFAAVVLMGIRVGIAYAAMAWSGSRELLQLAWTHRRENVHLDWRVEVLPFQAKIAVSSIAGYLMSYTLNPILFRIYGPEYAGQWGMTYTLLTAAMSFSLLWVSTSAPRLCGLLAREQGGAAWSQFKASARRGLAVFGGLIMAFLVLVLLLDVYFPVLRLRLLPMADMAWLIMAMLGVFLIMAMNFLVRAHRREDFMLLLVALGVATVAGGVVLGLQLPASAVNAYYAVLLLGLGAPWAYRILRTRVARY